MLAGKEDLAEPLAGKSTLNRMELGTGINDRYKKITFWKEAVDELLVKVFIESHEKVPAEIVLDMDTTDLPLHGKQEGRFFHGYYDSYCYLPLYVFCGDHVLCARLREANHDAAFGCLREIERIVKQIRAAWPEVGIVLRGDSGFCRNELMSWCESSGVDYLFGMARNKRLRRIIGQQMQEATVQWKQTGKAHDARNRVAFEQEFENEFRFIQRQVHAIERIVPGFQKRLRALAALKPLLAFTVIALALAFDPAVVAGHRNSP